MSPDSRSRQTSLLAGAVLLAIAGRIYLSTGGAEAMVFTTPHLRQVDDVLKLLAFAALAVAVSAAVAAAGKRWVGRLASVGLGGVAGLVAISQYNAIFGATIGLIVGLLVACGIFLRVLSGLTKIVAAIGAGVACGAAALATKRDLSEGAGPLAPLLLAATVLCAGLVLSRRMRRPAPIESRWRWLRSLRRASLYLMIFFGLWLSLSVDTARRVNRIGFRTSVNSFVPERSWLWQGCVKVDSLWCQPELTDDGLSDLRGFADLEVLVLSETRVTDAGLAELDSLRRLRWLLLAKTKVTGEGCSSLSTLPALTDLVLDGCPVNDRGLEPIGKLVGLQYLRLGGTEISDSGLKHLQGMTWLSALVLDHTQVTDAGLQNLAPLSRLQSLALGDTRITDAGLEKLPVMPWLRALRLDGTQVTDAGLQHLTKQPLLTSVEVRETAVTAEGAEAFCKAMKRRTTATTCTVER